MKKVYIDATMVVRGISYTGIPRVVMEVTKQLNKSNLLDIEILEYDEGRKKFRVINKDAFIELCNDPDADRKHLRTDKRIGLSSLKEGSVFFDVDGIWKSRLNRSYLYPVLKKSGVKVITLIHDIIMVTHPQFCREDDILTFLEYIGAVMLYSDRVIVTTKTTKNYLTKIYGEICRDKTLSEKKEFTEKIGIVPLGADFKKSNDDTADRAGSGSEKISHVKKPYLLMIGTVEPRKNQKLLVDAYDRGLKNLNMNVVIAGHQGWHVEELIKRIEEHPKHDKGIYYINGASDEEIEELYKNCFALAFPSHIEGYGLPIMEAMYHKAPLILSDTPINHEMAGDKALYFGEDSPEELIEIVENLLSDQKEYDRLKKASEGFKTPSWEQTGLLIEKEILAL